ncbi:hypothetical protein THAOC_34581 [Thalassiosira oceanica]|uniref:Uncharacterized protein n=1 Tax=Thalassiosira oceanica TaxID=159749 RepID=K0R2A5_THAOC|nr:hypothetical protein THAOC_34581 [Thalassiosira oceanica]|eukprot:EJK46738.1 hypothetical protein THAOC_34581 [Thalassiosira oceanica]
MPGDASAAVDSGSGPAPSSALTVPGGSQQRVRKEDVECDVEALVKAASFDTDHSFRQKEVQGTFNCAGALTVAVAGATTNAMTRANDQTNQANQATMKQAFEFSQRAINRFCESTDKNTQANQTNMKEVLSSLGKMTWHSDPDQKKFSSMVATEVIDGVVKVASAKKVRPVELFSSTQPGGTGLGFETAVAPAVPSDSPEAGTSNASITQARVNEAGAFGPPNNHPVNAPFIEPDLEARKTTKNKHADAADEARLHGTPGRVKQNVGHDAKQTATKTPTKLRQTPKKRSTAEGSDGDINKTPAKKQRFSNSNPDKKNTFTSNNTEVQSKTFGSGYNHQLTSFSTFAKARAGDCAASSGFGATLAASKGSGEVEGTEDTPTFGNSQKKAEIMNGEENKAVLLEISVMWFEPDNTGKLCAKGEVILRLLKSKDSSSIRLVVRGCSGQLVLLNVWLDPVQCTASRRRRDEKYVQLNYIDAKGKMCQYMLQLAISDVEPLCKHLKAVLEVARGPPSATGDALPRRRPVPRPCTVDVHVELGAVPAEELLTVLVDVANLVGVGGAAEVALMEAACKKESTDIGLDYTLSPPPPPSSIDPTTDIQQQLSANAERCHQRAERATYRRGGDTVDDADLSLPDPPSSKDLGELYIGEINRANRLLLPVSIGPYGDFGPIFRNFLFGQGPRQPLDISLAILTRHLPHANISSRSFYWTWSWKIWLRGSWSAFLTGGLARACSLAGSAGSAGRGLGPRPRPGERTKSQEDSRPAEEDLPGVPGRRSRPTGERNHRGQALRAMDDSASGSKRKRDLRQDATEPGVFLYEGGEIAWEQRIEITRVRIGPQVEKIPCETFRCCINLTKVQFDEGALQLIGESAFARCTALRCVTMPSSVTELGTNAFSYCSNLAELHLNDGLRTIGKGAFSYCEQLRSVTMPSTVTNLGAYILWKCHNLVEVQLNEGLQCIYVRALYGCTELQCVTIPSTLTELGVGLFECCTKLAKVQITEGMQFVHSGAFYRCMALQSVTIPSTVTELGGWAFQNCSNLSEVILLGGQRFLNEEFLARRLSDEEGILRQEVVGILTDDGSAFRGCPLTRVKISISWAVSERIARLPFERRLPFEDRIRNLPRLELMPDGNVVAHFPLVREDDSESGTEEMVDIQDTNNATARSVYQLLQLISFHELKESSILIELAMWKSGMDGDQSRADCRVAIPGPVKSLIMEYCDFAGFLRPAMDGA